MEDPLIVRLRARNRLLLAHALIGIEVGLFMIAMGAPTVVEEAFGPWSRVVLGLQALLPSVVTLVGLAIGMNSVIGRRTVLAGLAGQITWHLAMAAALIYSIVEKSHVLALGQPLPEGALAGYGFWVYLNLALLVGVHVAEIIRTELADRRLRRPA